jgi:DNA-binding MarR family transcriptional regulator
MSDLRIVLQALPRIHEACRARHLPGTRDGHPSVSDHQARILAYLDDSDPTMVTELADHMGVTASTMSLNLKRLREAGLVRSSRDPDDRRVMNVLLTEAGMAVRETVGRLDPGRVDALLRRLGPETRHWAVTGLKLLADAVASE